MIRPLLTLLLLLAAQPGFGLYITDKLLAGFYAQPDAGTQPLRALSSGTPLEILERKTDFSRVRLGDNSEGWVENRFITAEKPAKVRLLELQARNAELLRRQEGHQPAATPSESSTDPPPRQSLLRENARLRSAIEQARAALAGEAGVNPGAPPQPTPETRLPLWLLPLAPLLLLLGFIGGIAFKNYRIARRAAKTGLSRAAQ
ncbi:MAG: TIGR04211 family SH3 domain-containing protein [Gammaproteobacteria bacterium]|nr:TIGR04211 family SH3 domain-containing protein [Gammaproteobacteria bacterium]